MRTEALFNFIQERYAIHTRRERGLPKPWTQDPILQNYRFCNVYRELDTVTQWIAERWRTPNTSDPDVWFAMAVARFVNWPDTLEEIGYPVPWEGARRIRPFLHTMSEHFCETLEARKKRGEKVFTGAYMISASSEYSRVYGSSKAGYIADFVLTPLWKNREYIREATGSLAHFYSRLIGFNGVGSFMAGQIVCDTKYTRLLEAAPDWWQWACPGPGSQRGLNRVMSRPVNQNWSGGEWFVELCKLKAEIGPMVLNAGMPSIHAQDLQNCLCEFDKYERVRLGEGKPRSKYPGASQTFGSWLNEAENIPSRERD
jgi:hypothetical protein